ncbi:MAG: hypothetical protein PHD00_12180 [Bacteroidales bacterium]|jgi:hypothetical protein|nr:hypothetical protein [Bacteroidales bacterium]HCX98507.1 hypothetical protein [Bacteroidales bacterium]
MKTLIKICLLLLVLLTACKKDDSHPFYLTCKINGKKWEALKYESLLSNRHVLAARAYYDPDSAWLQVGGSRSVKTPSQPDSYMHGSMTINIIDFEGEGSYILKNYPLSGSGLYFWRYHSWANMDIRYTEPFPAETYNASTTDEYTGVCTITKFDTTNQIIEGEFHFDALHRDFDVVANVTAGKFRLEYEIKEIGS